MSTEGGGFVTAFACASVHGGGPITDVGDGSEANGGGGGPDTDDEEGRGYSNDCGVCARDADAAVRVAALFDAEVRVVALFDADEGRAAAFSAPTAAALFAAAAEGVVPPELAVERGSFLAPSICLGLGRVTVREVEPAATPAAAGVASLEPEAAVVAAVGRVPRRLGGIVTAVF